MNKLITILVLGIIGVEAQAQESMQQVMEKRAREMHRVLCLADKDQWKKFITENYTQALIERPMKSQVSKSDGSTTASEKNAFANNLEAKVNMFQRMHDDFGESKITSIKTTGEQLEMVLTGPGLIGTFNLKFSNTKPYLIDGLGIQAEAGNR